MPTAEEAEKMTSPASSSRPEEEAEREDDNNNNDKEQAASTSISSSRRNDTSSRRTTSKTQEGVVEDSLLATVSSSKDADMQDADDDDVDDDAEMKDGDEAAADDDNNDSMDEEEEEEESEEEKDDQNDSDVHSSAIEEEEEEEESDDDDHDDVEDEDYSDIRTRRSRRVASNKNNKATAAATKKAATAAAAATDGRRTSSRSNKFTSSMAEPTGVRDLLAPVAKEEKKPRGGKTKRNTKKKSGESSSSGHDTDDTFEGPRDNRNKNKRSRPTRTTTRGRNKATVKDDSSSASSSAAAPSRAGLRPRRQAAVVHVRDSLGSTGSTSPITSPTKKSPARRHRKARRSLQKCKSKSTDEDDDDDDDDGFGEVDSDASDEEELQDDDEDAEEMKIQRIIACRTETMATWREICATINTSEIDNGSRWFQQQPSTNSSNSKGTDDDDDDDKDDGDKKKMDSDDDVYQERFLVKWADLSYMHCSWETLHDLVEQVENAKTYHSTFMKKSFNGKLYSADERADGQYFDPRFTQIERILEVSYDAGDDDEKSTYPQTAEHEDTVGSTDFGIITDKDDPRYEDGVGRQLLIKWAGNSPYGDCTYEYERDLILQSMEYKPQLKSFWNRRSKPSKKFMTAALKRGEEEMRRLYKAFGDNSNWSDEKREEFAATYQKELEEHVFKNGGALRDYQAHGVAWMISNYVNERSCILADEMGLGKTLQTAATLNIVSTKLDRAGIFLVVVPLSTLSHWHREFSSWTDLNAIVYHGTAEDRLTIREYEFAYEQDRPQGGVGINQYYLKKCGPKKFTKNNSPWMAQVVITTPEMLVNDAELFAVHWDILIVDEAHRLKNHNSKLSVKLRQHSDSIDHMMLLSGTPIQNNVEEFFALLTLIDPENYPDLAEFMETYGDMKNSETVDSLHEEIRPYILRRLKEDVEKSVPPKEETIIEVELTLSQKTYYRALLEKNVRFLHKNKSKTIDGPSLSNLAMQLRKCCNSVLLLNGIEEELAKDRDMHDGDFLASSSGKLILLDKLLPRLKQEGHRVLIFSQFKIMLDILEDYLDARSMKFERIDGSITGHKRQMAIDRYQSSDSKEPPFIMLLSTRAGGVGINLTAADTCIIFDSDFNPQNDLQAQARCHRIGQENKVQVYRLLSSRTYEMKAFHVASLKMGLDQVVLKGFESGSSGDGALSKKEVEKLLRHGAYDILNEDKDGKSEENTNAFLQADIDSILERRSRTVVHDGPGSSAAGGTFSKASFKVSKSPVGSKGNKSPKEDVDIDDPDFWRKMLGDAHFQEDPAVNGTRKRTKANYCEPKYAELDAAQNSSGGSDSESSFDSEHESNGGRERSRWGGGLPHHWKKEQVESLVQVLLGFGYGNLPWKDFKQRIDGITAKSELEIRRMCFSIVLMVLLEAAENDASSSRKREERAAAKRMEAQADKAPTEGGLLAVDRSMDPPVNLSSLDDLKTSAFAKLRKSHASWLEAALADAVAYAKENTARGQSTLHNALNPLDPIAEESSPEMIAAVAAFEQNVWPSLSSRGWESEDGDSPGPKRYSFKGQEFTSLEKLLGVAKDRHPEIEHVIDRALSALETAKVKVLESKKQEKAEHLSLTVENANPGSLQALLKGFAPLQLLVDRSKQTQGVSLPRKILSTCTSLHAATSLVKKAAAGGEIDLLDRLESLIVIDKRTFLPHPLWTLRHDAILINAMVKHGWIDCDASCREIIADPSIRFGPPFEACASAPSNEKATPDLLLVAERAALLLDKNEALFEDVVKSFDQNSVVRAYSLRRNVLESGSDVALGQVLADSTSWSVNREALMGEMGSSSEAAELPTKKDLVRRVKTVLSRASESKDASAAGPSASAVEHSYAVLDQSDRCNVLLASILRGLLTTKTGSKACSTMFDLALREARKRVEDMEETRQESPASDKDTVAKQKQDLERIVKHIELAKRNMNRYHRLSKNVIRVVLAQNPVPPKNPGEGYFPSEKIAPAPLKTAPTHVSVTKSTGELAFEAAQKRIADENNTGGSDLTGATGDTALFNLTQVEEQILRVVSFFGLPVWTKEWKNLVEPSGSLPSNGVRVSSTPHVLTWGKLGRCLLKISRDQLNTATAALNDAKNFSHDSADLDAQSKAEESMYVAERHYESAEHTLGIATDYATESEGFAKKVIVLCSKLVKKVGKLTPSTKSDNGLGTRVLRFLGDQVQAWGTALDLLDENDKVFAVSAEDYLADLDEDERSSLSISSSLDKKGCRAVMSSIAMISRARAIFSGLPSDAVEGRMEVAVFNINKVPTEKWSNQPSWWGESRDLTRQRSVSHDLLLMKRLLDSGMSGVLETEQDFDINALHAGKSFGHVHLTKGDIQFRCNQLTRELHAIGDSGDAMRLVQESNAKNVKPAATTSHKVQTGIQSFFGRPSGKPKAKVPDSLKPKLHAASPGSASKPAARRSTEVCYSDVEIVESPDPRSSKKKKGTKRDSSGASSGIVNAETVCYSDVEVVESPCPSKKKDKNKKDGGGDDDSSDEKPKAKAQRSKYSQKSPPHASSKHGADGEDDVIVIDSSDSCDDAQDDDKKNETTAGAAAAAPGGQHDDNTTTQCFDVEEVVSPHQQIKGKRKGSPGAASDSSDSSSEKKPRAS